MSNAQEVWWRPGGRRPFALDPTKPQLPQIAAMIAQGLITFGGPVIGLVTINDYPFLIEDRTLYGAGIASIVFWFLASFAIFRKEYFPKGMPPLLKLPFRAGFGLCMTALLLGVAGIVNGYAMPLVSRDVAVVSKHTTRHSDPARRTYYLAIRAWPPSTAIVELGAPREVYDRIHVPLTAIGTPQHELEAMRDSGHVRLVVGEGRLGLEWLKNIEPARSDANVPDWVRNKHPKDRRQCPLCPSKQTCFAMIAMSALCQKRTLRSAAETSLFNHFVR